MPRVYVSAKYFEPVVCRTYFHTRSCVSVGTRGVSGFRPIGRSSLLRSNAYLAVGGFNRSGACVDWPTFDDGIRDFIASLSDGNYQIRSAGILRKSEAAPFHQGFLDFFLGFAIGEGIIHGLARIGQDQHHDRFRLPDKVRQ